MTEDVINGPLLEMLCSLESVFRQFDIDFYLVGAFARDIHLSVDPAFTSSRKTKDVDIAVMISNEEQFYEVKEAILATVDFIAHDKEAIKLIYSKPLSWIFCLSVRLKMNMGKFVFTSHGYL